MSTAIPPFTSLPAGSVSAYSGDTLRDVAVAFIILEIIFVFLRFLSRYVGKSPLGVDDWLMIPALFLCLGLDVTSLIALDVAAVGHHMVAVEEKTPEKLIPWAKVLIISPILYSAAVCLPKLAILVFYSRIFISKFQRRAAYLIMAVVTATAIADIIASGLQCVPLEYMWNKNIDGSCFDIPIFFRYGTLPNSLTDVLMLILPMGSVWSLQMSTRNKIGATATLLVGSVGLITSILRTVAFFKHNPLIDGTWNSVIFLYWTIIEPGCYLIAACLLCCGQLFQLVTSMHSYSLVVRKIQNLGKHSRTTISLSENTRWSHPASEAPHFTKERSAELTATERIIYVVTEDEERLVGMRHGRVQEIGTTRR